MSEPASTRAPRPASEEPGRSPWQPELPAGREQRDWGRLYGDALTLALERAARHHAGPLVVVAAGMQQADRLAEDLRFFAGADLPVLGFPDWETLPYDTFSPHQDIVSQRIEALYRLPQLERGILVVPVATLMQRVAPHAYLDRNTLVLDRGQKLDLDAMRERLTEAGYRYVSQVMEHGEFAVRGSLLDLFPMGSSLPYRIDLFDEEVESLRTFDPDSQRSLDKVDSVRLLPAREFPLDGPAVTRFRQAYRATFEGDPQASPVYRDVSQGIAPGGIEYYLPLFFEHTATLFDYLPAAALFALLPETPDASGDFWSQARDRFEQRRHDLERPVLGPERLFLDPEGLNEALAAHPRIRIQRFEQTAPGAVNYATRGLPDVSFKPRAPRPAAALTDFLADFHGRVLFITESTGRRETLHDMLREQGIRPAPVDGWQGFADSGDPVCLAVGPLEQGLLTEHPPRAVITETQLFGERVRQTRRHKPSRDPEAVIRDLTDLNPGAPVVHEDHGVGRYLGLQRLTVGGVETEFLTLEYAGSDKLYVPVSSLDLISRYSGTSPEQAPLHKLGTDQWQRARRKAAERMRDVAAELLDIYARRAARTGHRCQLRPDEYGAFASAFPFEETPDQQAAIEAVIQDLAAAQPMDRVVCGDVGFGKTEVALRAAFVVAQDGGQVAVLVPTTLLAQQHLQNFRDRFADWPVRIEVLSRFRSKTQQDKVLAGLEDGTVDIVVGTHKLLQPSIRFKNLGLVIVDEEHRFGVRQKEKLKKLRAEVDLLTLTATPIPRTLNMSLSGLRDLSIIATPPAHRLAVKTFVCEWDNVTLREACLREIKRGGQVYFLHNEVESIARVGRSVSELVPEAGVRIAHGQMRERELEQVMLDFYHRRFNVLVCTTIIESGIDVPTANTIIINRADRLGLAQLHQLRGRVGRSHHRAYAYLVVPPRKAMTADAVKRLEAVESLEELGGGFTLATHDLEIRGAGELLGAEQSGQIQEIGFTLYRDLLERTVAALKAGRDPELEKAQAHGPEIELHIPALIPDDYLPDVHTRLILYKRIASAETADALRDLQVEMIDRFGLLPDQTRNLFRIAELKLRAAPMGISRIEAGESSGRVLFTEHPAVDPGHIIALIQNQPRRYKLDGADRLRFNAAMGDTEQRLSAVQKVLEELVSGETT
ncbi:MAG TPA: transcription-repair coupling factor [Gammaproteobacteria bacterium]|nr:transcription-repair coupling factor [Gammaproteobacteria bacterium]